MEVGVDIVRVDRIKNAILNNSHFKHRVFTKKEIEYCEKRKNKYESYAGKFAAKEAFQKAFLTSVDFLDIEILNMENGKPYINYKDLSVKLSISHEKEYAIAYVIVEREI